MYFCYSINKFVCYWKRNGWYIISAREENSFSWGKTGSAVWAHLLTSESLSKLKDFIKIEWSHFIHIATNKHVHILILFSQAIWELRMWPSFLYSRFVLCFVTKHKYINDFNYISLFIVNVNCFKDNSTCTYYRMLTCYKKAINLERLWSSRLAMRNSWVLILVCY